MFLSLQLLSALYFKFINQNVIQSNFPAGKRIYSPSTVRWE